MTDPFAGTVAHACQFCRARFHTHDQVMEHKLDHIIENQEKIMGSQQDIDAAVAALTDETTGVQAAVTTLDNAVEAIAAELATLQSAGVDTSALDAAVAGLGPVRDSLNTAVSAAAAIAPAPPAADGTASA